jgi:hypothetical protein
MVPSSEISEFQSLRTPSSLPIEEPRLEIGGFVPAIIGSETDEQRANGMAPTGCMLVVLGCVLSIQLLGISNELMKDRGPLEDLEDLTAYAEEISEHVEAIFSRVKVQSSS